MDREPGSDDHLGDETHLDVEYDEHGQPVVVRRPGPPPAVEPPPSPLAPVLPDAYLRWVWATTEGARGVAESTAVMALRLGLHVREVRAMVRDVARSTRRRQHEIKGYFRRQREAAREQARRDKIADAIEYYDEMGWDGR